MRYLVAIASIAILVTSCSDSPNQPNSNGGGKSWLGSFLTVAGLDDVLTSFDTTNVKCAVLLFQSYSETIDWDSNSTVTPFLDHEARSIYHPTIDSSVSLSPISINGTSLGSDGMLFGHGTSGFQTNFSSGSSTNSIYKPSSDAVLGTRSDTSITFEARIRFSGVAPGDTIDISSGETINFTGSGSAPMHISVLVTHPDNPNDGNQQGYSEFFDGASSVSLSSSDLAGLAPGKGEVMVSKFEPKVVSTSNGNKVVLFAYTQHRVSVVFVP